MNEDKNPKDLTKEDTLSMVSHELRTSLTASKWMLGMLKDGDVGEITTDQKEIIGKLIASNSRMMEVATNLIILSKEASGQSVYHMEDLDVVDIISSVVFELGSEAFSKHIEIIYKKPERAIPKINGDEEKLRIVFQNIIDNAIKYNKSGGNIKITIIKEPIDVKITIEDTGMGISKEDLPLVTKQFYRGENATKSISIGSGIGLYIGRCIIEGHHGKIKIDSTIDTGTTVIVTIPISK